MHIKHIKKYFIIILLIVCISTLVGCSSYIERTDSSGDEWGSFTDKITQSYDGKYYAVQTVEQGSEHHGMIKVSVYQTETDKEAASFYPARALDFWGICWESDTYNIWIQSADIGIYCYKYDSEKWILDENAQQPDDIISKYDKYK